MFFALISVFKSNLICLYISKIILGSVRTQDLKFMTADFAGLFGSEAGDQLVDFCKRHKLPLAWSLGDKKNNKYEKQY